MSLSHSLRNYGGRKWPIFEVKGTLQTIVDKSALIFFAWGWGDCHEKTWLLAPVVCGAYCDIHVSAGIISVSAVVIWKIKKYFCLLQKYFFLMLVFRSFLTCMLSSLYKMRQTNAAQERDMYCHISVLRRRIKYHRIVETGENEFWK